MSAKTDSPAKQKDAALADRRRLPRFAVNPKTSCRIVPVGGSAAEPAQVPNISTAGVNVVVPRRHEVGSVFVLELTSPDGILRRELTVRVVRVQEHGGGKFGLGCAFLSPLDGHELLTLVL